jgi:thiosulfate/3-mercaptopyruvate sulfurtransferase
MTEKRFSPIIDTTELQTLQQTGKIILIDVSNNKNARTDYEQKHLEGALYVDLNSQLADIKIDIAQGGRHPLPSIEIFSNTLTSLGITPDSHVVLYDHANGANAAARFWWMLKSVGHVKAQVLNGGFQEAVAKDLTCSDKIEIPQKVDLYPITNWDWPLINIEEVKNATTNPCFTITDVRDSDRYNGINEPLDLVAGHIPNAINIPFSSNLDEHGLFLSIEKIKQNYKVVLENTTSENTIIHCGSGVTACHSILAMYYAGLAIPKLYVGSWSEWSRH